jgi:hypothetical protein
LPPNLDQAERWLAVVGYEGIYEVSSAGRIRCLVRRPGGRGQDLPLTGSRTRGGYVQVKLTGGTGVRTHAVHRLVAAAFLGPRPAGMQVNHKDCDKANNRAENLEYLTPSANMRHAAAAGRLGHNRGEGNPNARLTAVQVAQIRALAATRSRAELARAYGVSPTAISAIVLGYKWKDVARS